MSQNNTDLKSIASKYLNNTIRTKEEALEGARHIIAEWINERLDIRNQIRYQLEKFAQLTSKVISSKKDDEKAQKFRDYFDWNESLNKCPSHRFLAILRAENEGFIRVKIDIDKERALSKIEDRVLKSSSTSTQQIKLAIEDSYKRLLLPSLSNELMRKAKEKADDAAFLFLLKTLNNYS